MAKYLLLTPAESTIGYLRYEKQLMRDRHGSETGQKLFAVAQMQDIRGPMIGGFSYNLPCKPSA
jgi:hypothetical protein